MKVVVRWIEFEGTPEEFARAGLERIAAAAQESDGTPGDATHGSALGGDNKPAASSSTFPADVEGFVASRRDPVTQAAIRSLVAEALSWGSVKAVTGGTARGGGPAYVRLQRRGSSAGSFMYLNRNRGVYRLPRDQGEGSSHARLRNVKATNPHQISVDLDDPAALDEARELMRKAYERAASGYDRD